MLPDDARALDPGLLQRLRGRPGRVWLAASQLYRGDDAGGGETGGGSENGAAQT